MKKLVFPLIVAITLGACNSNSASSNVDSDSLTKVENDQALKDSANFTTVEWLDSTSKDLGKVKKGQVIEIPFTFKNTGEHPLIVANIAVGCGCTVAEKPEKPIMPGKEDKIVAKFDSENQSTGVHVKNLTVQTNTKPFTEQVLNFKVDVTE